MEQEEMSQRLFSYFKKQLDAGASGKKPQIQIGSGMMSDFQDAVEGLPAYQRTEFELRVLGIIHEFIRNGWLHPGNTLVGSGNTYPWITITEIGKEIFSNEEWAPFDPDGYVSHIQAKIPSISQVTLQYLGEAVAAYHRRHLLSATLTLGVASENEIISLIDAYLKWLPETRASRLQSRILHRNISTQYEEFKKSLITDLHSLPDELKNEWEVYLDGIFQFIRLNRNSVGHPTGKQLAGKIVFANLQVFSDYSIFIHKMIDFFSA